MAPAIDDTVLVDRTKERRSTSVTDPYLDAIDEIQVAITRNRTKRESLNDMNDDSGFIEDSNRSQSPSGLTNESQTIQRIEEILKELERTHGIPRSKLSHDSSTIDADLASNLGGVVPALSPVTDLVGAIPSLNALKKLHPTDFAPYNHHIDKITTFENDLMKAFNSSQSTKVKYKKVEVLLLTWEPALDDDIREEVQADTEALLRLFEEVKYDVTPVSIARDRRTCWNKLQRAISRFVEKYEDVEDDEVLLLIHYNGHGSIRNKKSFWHPTAFAASRSDAFDALSEQNGPTIEYNDVYKIFDSINQDMLFILDCCYAGAASNSKGPSNTKELLAACGSANRTPALNSFTSRFVSCFRDLLKIEPIFQVGWLYHSMINVSQKPLPMHAKLNNSSASICLSSLASLKSENDNGLRVATSGLSNDGLAPEAMLGRIGSPSSAASSKALSIFSDDNDVSVGNTRPTSVHGGSDEWDYEVLITVKLHADVIPSLSSKGWDLTFPFTQIDSNSSSVKVRASMISKSSLLLVTLPINCWILLPDNPAYMFIDFVKTDSYFNSPQGAPEPTPAPAANPAIDAVHRSDSDKSIITAIKEFFDKLPEKKEKSGPFGRMTSKIGLYSYFNRYASDPTFGYVRHIMQSLVVVRNDDGESSQVKYDLQYIGRKEIWKEKVDKCKKHLIEEVLSGVGPDKLEDAVSADLEQLKIEVLELVEVEKTRPKIEPRTPSEWESQSQVSPQ